MPPHFVAPPAVGRQPSPHVCTPPHCVSPPPETLSCSPCMVPAQFSSQEVWKESTFSESRASVSFFIDLPPDDGMKMTPPIVRTGREGCSALGRKARKTCGEDERLTRKNRTAETGGKVSTPS